MQKYSSKFKLTAVLKVLNENLSHAKAWKLFNVRSSVINKWVTNYKSRGIEGLERSTTHYYGKFKLNVIEYILANHLPYRETLIKFDIKNMANICAWKKIYEEKGSYGLLHEKPRRRRPPVKLMPEEKKKKRLTHEQELLACTGTLIW